MNDGTSAADQTARLGRVARVFALIWIAGIVLAYLAVRELRWLS